MKRIGQTIAYIFHMLADFIIIIVGVYLGFLIRFFGRIPPENFMPFIKIWYLFGLLGVFCLWIFGLYTVKGKIKSREIIKKSFYAIAISTLIMMDIAYIFREEVMLFPSSIFIISIVINTLLCGLWRIFILYDNESK